MSLLPVGHAVGSDEHCAANADEGHSAVGCQADRIPFRPFLVRDERDVNTKMPVRSAGVSDVEGPRLAPSQTYSTRISWLAHRRVQ